MEKSPVDPTQYFSDQVVLSVSIKSSQEVLYNYLTDIENLTQFFPGIEFRVISEGPLAVGSVYHTRQKGAKNWSPYRVVALEKNRQMSAMLTGKDPLFAALRYDHTFIRQGDETVSHETVDYTFRFGFAGRILNAIIGKKLVKKQVLDAHRQLKATAESLPGGG
ncbi:MAG: SRPBCC family protein [Paracoccaceae bacterium]